MISQQNNKDRTAGKATGASNRSRASRAAAAKTQAKATLSTPTSTAAATNTTTTTTTTTTAAAACTASIAASAPQGQQNEAGAETGALERVPRTRAEAETAQRLIVVLSQAALETVKVGKMKDAKYQLLSGDEHAGMLARHGRDPALSRPDITHQCLLTLLDSPLNKAGRLQIFISTAKNVLIEVSPKLRLPRTYKRFCGLMVQLLHKLHVSAFESSEKLLRVIKNPITEHLPVNSRRVCFSFDADTMRLRDLVRQRMGGAEKPSLVVFLGAMAHGADTFADEYGAEKISISEYSLSASVACGKLCCALEDYFDIL